MPTYTYLCVNCEMLQDVTHAIDHGDPVVCIMGHEMVKRFAPVPAIFKGSGFYKTDKG